MIGWFLKNLKMIYSNKLFCTLIEQSRVTCSVTSARFGSVFYKPGNCQTLMSIHFVTPLILHSHSHLGQFRVAS